jgi:calcineurin-like phosphoesterase family protein
MTQKVWIISDTHFGHALMAQTRGFYGNIEAHDHAIVEAWNSVVREGDTVWHLGDVYFREGWKCLGALKGNKKLVMGNHDAAPSHAKILSNYFALCGCVEVGQNILSHIPVHPNQLTRFRLNIHGHMHSNKVDDSRYVCASIEQLDGFRPIQLIEACNRGSPI